MEVPDIQGLDKLYQAISEASEIEKCSICLERLESTVLLWPCTHWYCNKCILTLHKSARGEKVACPLCNCVTTRRKILHFQDKQTEYEDHLQTLIGALSLDLKFDVTSYNNARKNGNPLKNELLETSKEVFRSPVKRTRSKAPVRVVEVKKKPQEKKRINKLEFVQENKNLSSAQKNNAHIFKSPKPSTPLLPETPDSPRKKKVIEWLDSTKFSQADQDVCVETVVADVHNAEFDESLNLSETVLLSVSQVDHGCTQKPNTPVVVKKPNDTSSDIDAIKVCNNSSEKFSSKGNLRKKMTHIPDIEKFDQIFPENKQLQTITTTYGSKNPYTSTLKRAQRFTVQEDVFENKNDSEKSGSGEPSDNSETLEDFSSGSGEEWTIEKRPRKSNLLGKCTRTNMKQTNQGKIKNSIEKYVSSNKRKDSKNFHGSKTEQTLKDQKRRKNNVQSSNHKEDSNLTKVKCVAVEEFSKPKDDAVKEIIDDWNDTKDTNNIIPESQPSAKHNGAVGENSGRKCKTVTAELCRPKPPAKTDNTVLTTPCKEVKTRSPGWSRLKSTKKDFHLSEKKKLSLKTQKSNSSLTNIGISPLLNQSKSSVSSNSNLERSTVQSHDTISVDKIIDSRNNKINDKNLVDVDASCDIKNKKTPELIRCLNTSLASSASGSPFRGFTTQDEKDSLLKLDKVAPNNSFNSSSLPQKHSEKNNKEQIKEIQALHSNNHMEVENPMEDPMEVDILPIQGSKLLPICKNNNENYNIRKKMEEANYKSSTHSSFLEAQDVTPVTQEKPNGSSVFTKKRDRDSGFHNESGVSSPVRKRVCRDAEVQTSPGRMKSAIRDMVKDMCGVELDDIIKQSTKVDLTKKLESISTSPDHNHPSLSQDSDKENVDIGSKNRNISKKCSDDSDIVYGTEESLNRAQTYHCVAKGENVFYNADVDPDAPTQRYKTPIVPKKPLHTSTKEYTVVSNPTSSELKRTDFLFDKSDLIFPDETPKCATPWNYSGVNKLEGTTGTVKKSDNKSTVQSLSQNSKERNRSRRQLDFVEESSSDAFEFERQISKEKEELCKESVNKESNNFVLNDKAGISHDQVDELEDIFMQSNELMDTILDSPEKNAADPDRVDIVTVQRQEKDTKNKLESEHLSDTPGIVGPSEVQVSEKHRNLCASDNPSNKSECEENVNKMVKDILTDMDSTKKTSEVGESTNQNTQSQQSKYENVKDPSRPCLDDALMVNETSSEQKATSSKCAKAREEDEESNPSSDVSFVEGTPDVSQHEVNLNEVPNVENDTKRTPDPLINANANLSIVQDKKEKSGLSLGHTVHKIVSRSTEEEMKQKYTEKSTVVNESTMLENSEVEQEYLCFASSLLNPQQTQVLVCVLAGMGLVYSKTVGPHISHLIVGTKNGCFQNTYKVLLAMALHKPIIRFDWVEEVIRTGGTVPLDPFVALDPSGECGVLRAKADKNRTLLHDFAIHIYNVNDKIVLKEQIEELVRLCGGTVVKELQDFCNIPRDKFRIIVLSEPPDSLTQGDWRHKYSAVEVMIDWVYNTIGRYRVMPLVPFMVTEAVDAIPFLQHVGYPKELIFDLSTQD